MVSKLIDWKGALIFSGFYGAWIYGLCKNGWAGSDKQFDETVDSASGKQEIVLSGNYMEFKDVSQTGAQIDHEPHSISSEPSATAGESFTETNEENVANVEVLAQDGPVVSEEVILGRKTSQITEIPSVDIESFMETNEISAEGDIEFSMESKLTAEVSQMNDSRLDSTEVLSTELEMALVPIDDQEMNVDEKMQFLAPNYNLCLAVQKAEEAIAIEPQVDSRQTVPLPTISKAIQSTPDSGKITMDLFWQKTDMALNWLSIALTPGESGLGVKSPLAGFSSWPQCTGLSEWPGSNSEADDIELDT